MKEPLRSESDRNHGVFQLFPAPKLIVAGLGKPPSSMIAWTGLRVLFVHFEDARDGKLKMDRTVADLNIAHFKKLLSTEVDPVKRQMIERLLADEEAKLDVAQPRKEDTSDET